MKLHQLLSSLAALAVSLAYVAQAQEDDTSETEQSEETSEAIVLPIEIQTTVIAPGKQTYNETTIRNAPVGHNDLADVMKLNPAVDFARESELSAGTASLRPAEISIHGQPFYQNLFLIDGTDTTNDLNPASGGDVYAIPSLVRPLEGSSPQGYYVDTTLLDTIEVHDSNIPVEYGGFTGGVVAAELREFKGDNWVDISYGHKRDDWEKFHITEDDITSADKWRGVYTPEYKKEKLGLSLVRQLHEDLGIVLGITRRTSRFAQEYEDDTDTLRQIYYDDQIHNIVGRINTEVGNTPLGVSFRYSQRAHDGLTSTTYTGSFVKDHTGVGFTVDFQPAAFDERLDLKLSFDRLSDMLDSTSNDFTYHEYLEDSGISRYEGAYGDLKQQQSRVSFKPKYLIASDENSRHTISIGGELRRTDSFYERPETITYEQYFCVRDDRAAGGCIDQDGDGQSSRGDEFLNRRFFYHAGLVDLKYEEASAYIEDIIDLDNTEIRLGLRGDWGSFLKNFNVSPRATLAWSPTALENSTLTTGLSRYYGRSFLRYELNDAIWGWRESYFRLTRPRGRDGEEVPCSVPDFENCTHTFFENRSGGADLKTPYADELSLGWTQPMLGFNSRFQIVQRFSRDGVSRQRDDDGLYYYRNLGESETLSATVAMNLLNPFEIGGSATQIDLGFSYRDSKSNYQDDDAYDSDLDFELIYYKGQLIEPSQLPPWDYNIPFGIRAHSVTTIAAWNVEWMNFFNIRNGGTIARDTRENYVDPTTDMEYDVYDDFEFDNLVTVDSRIRWQPQMLDRLEPYLQIEVHNLLDKVADQSLVDSRRRFTSGRRIAMEVGVRF